MNRQDFNESLGRGSLLLWIDKKMDWLAPAGGKRGRAEMFSDAAIQFFWMVRNLFVLALRKSNGMVASLLKWSGLDWPMPDYTTLCRRQQHLQLDSTGVKMLGEGEWKTGKSGAEYCR